MNKWYSRQFNYQFKWYSLRNLINRVYNKIKFRYINEPTIFLNKNPKYRKYKIGDFTYGSPDGSPLLVCSNPRGSLTIGKYCSIGYNVKIFIGGTNHRTDWVSTYPFGAFFKSAENKFGYTDQRLNVVIGNDVWIGTGASIMSGVTIGNGSVIGAETVITKDVEPYSIVAGNPAKLIRKRFDDETITYLKTIKWWDWDNDTVLARLDFILNEPSKDFLNSFTENPIIVRDSNI